MKYVKYLVFAVVITAVMSVSGVSAAIYQAYAGFNIPSMQKVVNAGTVTKSDHEKHVVGMLSTKDTRDIYVRLNGKGISGVVGTSKWVLLEITKNSDSTKYSVVHQFSTEDSVEAYGMVPGNVQMDMKTRNWYLDGTYFNGTWYSSVTVYNQLKYD